MELDVFTYFFGLHNTMETNTDCIVTVCKLEGTLMLDPQVVLHTTLSIRAHEGTLMLYPQVVLHTTLSIRAHYTQSFIPTLIFN
jgi:hypothetical protein